MIWGWVLFEIKKVVIVENILLRILKVLFLRLKIVVIYNISVIDRYFFFLEFIFCEKYYIIFVYK